VIFLGNRKKNIYIIEGTDNNVERFFKAMQILWDVEGIKIQKLEYKGCDILSKLSNDQKKILNQAKKFGYYDYPRKITSEELSKIIGVNKEITLENLRKAEKLVFTRILAEN
jgi:predicted DNA binding protein